MVKRQSTILSNEDNRDDAREREKKRGGERESKSVARRGHGVADSVVAHGYYETPRRTRRHIPWASREGSGTDGLRGFERNHGNVASPGRLPSDWLFLAFPPIYLGYSHEFRHAAQHRRHCPIIIYGAAQREESLVWRRDGRSVASSDIGVVAPLHERRDPDNSVQESLPALSSVVHQSSTILSMKYYL